MGTPDLVGARAGVGGEVTLWTRPCGSTARVRRNTLTPVMGMETGTMSRDAQPKVVQLLSHYGELYVLKDDGSVWRRDLDPATLHYSWFEIEVP